MNKQQARSKQGYDNYLKSSIPNFSGQNQPNGPPSGHLGYKNQLISFESKNTISKIRDLKKLAAGTEWNVNSFNTLRDANYKKSKTSYALEQSTSGKTTNIMNKRSTQPPRSTIQNMINNKFYTKGHKRPPISKVQQSKGFQSGYSTSFANFNLPALGNDRSKMMSTTSHHGMSEMNKNMQE